MIRYKAFQMSHHHMLKVAQIFVDNFIEHIKQYTDNEQGQIIMRNQIGM